MLFQVFLFSGIDGGGLSNTVPLQIGIGTLFGTFFTWLVDRRANLVFFIPGVILNLLAVVFDALTYHFLNKDNAKASIVDNTNCSHLRYRSFDGYSIWSRYCYGR